MFNHVNETRTSKTFDGFLSCSLSKNRLNIYEKQKFASYVVTCNNTISASNKGLMKISDTTNSISKKVYQSLIPHAPTCNVMHDCNNDVLLLFIYVGNGTYLWNDKCCKVCILVKSLRSACA